MAKKENRVQVILECTEQKESGVPGMSRYITTKNKKNTTQRLAGTVGLLFYVMKDFGKEQDTYLYANAFKFGLAVSFCSSIIAAAYYYLHVMFLFPESSSQMANAMLMGLEQAGVTEADFNIDKLIDRLPVILTLSQFVYFNILGLLWSSLLANGAKHPTDKTPFN
jgi:ribosomal protein L33